MRKQTVVTYTWGGHDVYSMSLLRFEVRCPACGKRGRLRRTASGVRTCCRRVDAIRLRSRLVEVA